jgi:hypothetical protein
VVKDLGTSAHRFYCLVVAEVRRAGLTPSSGWLARPRKKKKNATGRMVALLLNLYRTQHMAHDAAAAAWRGRCHVTM